MENNKTFLSLLGEISRIDWTKRGSIVTATVVNFFCVTIVMYTLKQIDVSISIFYYFFTLSAFELIILCLVFYNRYIRIFDPGTIAIGFAIYASPDSEKYYKDIQEKFRSSLITNNLTETVKMRKVPSDKRFKSKKDAEKYLESKGLRVLIWGDTSVGDKSSDKMVEFNIRLSFQHAKIDEEGQKGIVNAISDGVTRGVWGIKKTESLDGLKVVSGNIMEISLYTLAVCLVSVGALDPILRAVKILEHLNMSLVKRTQDANFPNLAIVQNRIRQLLAWEYWQLGVYYSFEKQKDKEAIMWLEKVLVIQPDNAPACINLARLSWKTGAHDDARTYTNRARRLSPQNPSLKLNYAFFDFHDGYYRKGLSLYKKLRRNKLKDNLMLESIATVEEEYESSSKPAFLFAAGWLNYMYADTKRAEMLLAEFLRIVDGNIEYECLAKESKELLSRL